MSDKITWVVIGLLLLSSIGSAISQLRKDIKRTNTILEKIAKQIGVPEPPVDEELKSLISDGQKIRAIKRYRDFTGVGLKEAKDYIDNLK